MAPQQETGRLPTPFKREGSESNIELEHLLRLMPASRRSKTVFHFNDRKSCPMDIVQRPKADVEFLAEELCVPSLNDIHDLLWLAGRPMPPRPLTYQLTASRTIAVVEDINLHLIWEPGRIFLKPIPRFLLNAAFWTKHLACDAAQDNSSCVSSVSPSAPSDPLSKRRELYGCAYGFLLSYTALIQHESDYRIAASNHLLPADVDWESWRQTSWELLENSPRNMTRVNKRYRYGELRLSRLNKISRWRSLTCSGDGLVGLMRGYKFGFATYGQLLEACLFPVVTATAYILLVLTAMQVGLSTDYLKGNFAFQQASWGFTVFSILAPLILIFLSFVLVFLYVVFNYRSTKAFKQRSMQFYDNLGRNGC
ncbi:hypothetical protein H634G_01711 [Metarhizium anisopliae BRIP 53293]|uniref:Subtilisin-like serine protease n=1 Tax=Metarhizium anisopliae BRIP 53293 TaxID=1291518 RepID=A0A0D9PBE1_METAN|nr:hypothetical protein H634G_01711 [Metarhizium anisopliae BRIP 53293]KJK87673.1 hypothetical protein H633G_08501 [Metarhizium anisopliae BRIP 53284]